MCVDLYIEFDLCTTEKQVKEYLLASIHNRFGERCQSYKVNISDIVWKQLSRRDFLPSLWWSELFPAEPDRSCSNSQHVQRAKCLLFLQKKIHYSDKTQLAKSCEEISVSVFTIDTWKTWGDWKPDKDTERWCIHPTCIWSFSTSCCANSRSLLDGRSRPQHERFLANFSWFLGLWHCSKKVRCCHLRRFCVSWQWLASPSPRNFFVSHFASRAWIKHALMQLYSLLSYDMASISVKLPILAHNAFIKGPTIWILFFLELPMSSQSYCAVAQTLWKWIVSSSLEHKSSKNLQTWSAF